MMKKEKNIYIYIDDMRQPLIPGAIWVKSYNEAIAAIRSLDEVEVIMNTPITFTIDFDHDLGEKKTGYDFAKWLIEQSYIGKFRIHSMNPVGARNIRQLLTKAGWKEIF